MKGEIEMLVAESGGLTVPQLRQRHLEVLGEPARSSNKPHLIKRIAWRIQANREGGLSERARRRAAELANDADLRVTAPRAPTSTDARIVSFRFRPIPDAGLPMPGTLLRREYKGQMVLVRVLENGFEYDGAVYRSLSAVAKRITGSHWNGRLFFGLSDRRREPADES